MARLRDLLRIRRDNAARDDDTQSADFDPRDREIIRRCRPFTLTSPLRIQGLLDAVDYCIARGVPGAFAECGVWRGGSVLAMILKLQALGVSDRTIYLFDTFDGMTEPSDRDTSRYSPPARTTWADETRSGDKPWNELFNREVFNEELVRDLLLSTGYPADNLRLVKGRVEETLPGEAAPEHALLRLDTDWYDSTMHELVHLYPRLCMGGVLIIDDYGHWDGCRQAVDEYFSSFTAPLLLNRLDYTGRIAVKA